MEKNSINISEVLIKKMNNTLHNELESKLIHELWLKLLDNHNEAYFKLNNLQRLEFEEDYERYNEKDT